MSNNKKQKLLSESLQTLGVSDVVREDLENFITMLIVQEKKSKETVIKELKELGQIVPENVNMEELVDWLWKLFVDGRMMSYQQYVDAKSVPSKHKGDITNNKQEALQALRLKSKTSSTSIESASKGLALNHSNQETKKRPANYDEFEKDQQEEEESKPGSKKSIFDRIKKHPKSEEKKIQRPEIEAPEITKRIKPSNKQTEKNALAPSQPTSRQPTSRQPIEAKAQPKNMNTTKTTEIKTDPPPLKSRITKEKNKPEVTEEMLEEPFEEPQYDEDEETHQEETHQAETPMKIKRRCRNWPNCKLGDNCAFHHPTEPCKFFPKCSYGDECLCIHPAIPCKFGAICARPDCAYLHPNIATTGRLPQNFGARPMKAKPRPRQENNVVS